jgi:hypothetical protein
MGKYNMHKPEFYYVIKRGIRHLSTFPRVISEFFIRGKNGWAPSDTWSLDYYNSKVMIGAISHLRSNNVGHPCLDEWSDNEEDWEFIWAAILTAMIDGFQACLSYVGQDNVKYFPPHSTELSSIHSWWTENEWAEMRAMEDEYLETFKENFKLYSEFYLNLWD